MNHASSPLFSLFDLGNVPSAAPNSPSPPTRRARRHCRLYRRERARTLHGHHRLARSSSDSFAYDASFAADVVQDCVVTLEPVRAHLEGGFTRRYRLLPKPSRRRGPVPDIEITDTGEDELEVLASPHVDLAAPLLEELSLALDPYPRAPASPSRRQRTKPPHRKPLRRAGKAQGAAAAKNPAPKPQKAKGKAKK